MINKLPAISIQEVIQAIIGGPIVTLHLTSGDTITGQIAVQGKDNGTLILATTTREGKFTDCVSYVHPSCVLGVTISQAESNLITLGRGKIDPVAFAEPVGKLGLQRESQALSEKLAKALGSPFALTIDPQILASEDNARDLAVAREAMTYFAECIGALAPDAMARESIQAKMKSAIIMDGDKAKLEFQGQTLLVKIPLKGEVSARFSRKSLDKALNEIL